jgi:hypothetical protein
MSGQGIDLAYRYDVGKRSVLTSFQRLASDGWDWGPARVGDGTNEKIH